MRQDQQQFLLETQSVLEACFDQVRFARAAELAQSERYLEAIALLSPSGDLPQSPRDLDLLARIATRQRRFKEARHFWETALQKEPHNANHADCLQHLSELEKPHALADTILTCLTWATVAFGVGALIFAFAR